MQVERAPLSHLANDFISSKILSWGRQWLPDATLIERNHRLLILLERLNIRLNDIVIIRRSFLLLRASLLDLNILIIIITNQVFKPPCVLTRKHVSNVDPIESLQLFEVALSLAIAHVVSKRLREARARRVRHQDVAERRVRLVVVYVDENLTL